MKKEFDKKQEMSHLIISFFALFNFSFEEAKEVLENLVAKHTEVKQEK